MNIQASNRLPLMAGGIAAILVSAIALGSLAISAQGSDGSVAAPAASPAAAALPPPESSAVRAYRCAECGVIEATRVVETAQQTAGVNASGRLAAARRSATAAAPAVIYEITIRLQDGSMRVVTDARPARWRHGEPVTIIAGAD